MSNEINTLSRDTIHELNQMLDWYRSFKRGEMRQRTVASAGPQWDFAGYATQEIAARSGTTPGKGTADIYRITSDTLSAHPTSRQATVYNLGTAPIAAATHFPVHREGTTGRYVCGMPTPSYIVVAEQASAPATPPSGFATIYVDSAGVLYAKNDSGSSQVIGNDPLTFTVDYDDFTAAATDETINLGYELAAREIVLLTYIEVTTTHDLSPSIDVGVSGAGSAFYVGGDWSTLTIGQPLDITAAADWPLGSAEQITIRAYNASANLDTATQGSVRVHIWTSVLGT